MRIIMFYHSVISDWNHGNAHFLRGVATELLSRGHEVEIYEPRNAWSVFNLLKDQGREPLDAFRKAYPGLSSTRYRLEDLSLDEVLDGADVVIVHEWNDWQLVKAIGEHRKRVFGNKRYALLFHDTHHRSVSARDEMSRYDLSGYDGVLAFGNVIRDIYLKENWTRNAWTWHEAADSRIFRPCARRRVIGDLVWIGNWGDDERSAELHEFLIRPVKELGLRARVYGVRYPDHALKALKDAKIEYGGWIPNFDVPKTFAKFRVTVHVPRRPYVKALPGIPTIRPFEAMACGIPLISAPWYDAEHLFRPGKDYLVAKTGAEMKRLLKRVLNDDGLSKSLVKNSQQTIASRHTCAHRVDQLLEFIGEIQQSIRAKTTFRKAVA